MGETPMRRCQGTLTDEMRQLRFNHVFAALMVISFVAAFILPKQTTPRKPQLAALFSPVARPAASFGNWMRGKVERKKASDTTNLSDDEVRAENDALRMAVANLSEQLALLKQINADRDNLGRARELCTPMKVVGGDSSLAQRETLSLGVTSDVTAENAVLYPEGIAGRVTHVGALGTQVRLITDNGFALTGTFCRYERTPTGDLRLVKIPTPPALVKGAGRNGMTVTNLLTKTVEDAKLAIGDWIILDDPTWPEPLKGYRIGKIVAIEKSSSSTAMYATLRVEPAGALSRLREVMVMNKTAPDSPRAGATE
jgi:cell shape-determining protein MreC